MATAAAEFLRFDLRRRFRFIRQTEAAECGLACVAMVADHFGLRMDLTSLRQAVDFSARGATARDLVMIADRLGLASRVVRCDLADLGKLRVPAILHWNMSHFVVLTKVRGRTLYLNDPAIGPYKISADAASSHFTGIAIELTPTPRFELHDQRRSVKLRSLIPASPALAGAFGQALLLSLILQVALLATPLYLQLVIDDVLARGDTNLLTVLLISVLAVHVFTALASLLRGLTVQAVTKSIGFDMTSSVFRHLIELPLAYFHRRQIGDIQQRFRSLIPVQQTLSGGAISALIDGALAIVIVALMLYVSPVLAIFTLIILAVSALIRVLSLRAVRQAAGAAMVAEAREQSRFLETLRASATIKVNAAEQSRFEYWRNSLADTVNAQIRQGNVTQYMGSVNQLLNAVGDAIIIFLGARLVLSQEMSIGVLTAFVAYKQMFSSRVHTLVEQVIGIALLDIQLDRVSDIVLTAREPVGSEESGATLLGKVELRNVTFRYSSNDPFILKGVDLLVNPGEFIAITGKSGGGKSTLLRLLVGLAEPTSGRVLIDDSSIVRLGRRSLRKNVSFVMQDDQLFAGSIADNITLFDDDPDMDLVEQAIVAASIKDEIAALPLGLKSWIGDMGSLLSGGQKQRLLIARALYRRPSILIMDEGTSHLDLAREMAVSSAIKKMAITRIIVAHRKETLQTADRVYSLDDGKLVLT